MRVLVIQNSERSGAGYLGEYLTAQHNACLTTIRPDALENESPVAYELVVVLGCSHGAYEDLAWIHRERAFVRAAIDADVPTIGICFGAQLIASAIGGASAALGRMYSGWYENDVASDSVWFGPWLRWHGDEIALPPAAEILAMDGETIQAFRFRRALGVQFHPEANAETLQNWIHAASTDQRERIDASALIVESGVRFTELSGERDRLFGSLLSLIGR
jgi:GMP synthase (glutamine-hydrolysing)